MLCCLPVPAVRSALPSMAAQIKQGAAGLIAPALTLFYKMAWKYLGVASATTATAAGVHSMLGGRGS